MEGQAAPYVHSNSMRARWGNVSHSARGGVDNHHDDPNGRTHAQGRRRPRYHPVLRNGW